MTGDNFMRSDIYIRDRGICIVCNSFVPMDDYELGHLVDKTMGGEAVYENVAVMHKQCNAAKPFHRTLREFMEWKLTRGLPDRKTNSLPAMPNINQYIKPKTQEKLKQIKPLTITWLQGKARWFIPPREDGTYHKEDKFAVGNGVPVIGVTKFGTGQGSTSSTLEILGETDELNFNEATIDLGIYSVYVHRVDNRLVMDYSLDKTKANVLGVNKYNKDAIKRKLENTH